MDHAEAQAIALRAGAIGRRLSCLLPLGCLALTGMSTVVVVVVAILMGLYGKGTIYVYSTDGAPVTVEVDGAEVARIAAPGPTAVKLSHGDHEVMLRRSDGETTFQLFGSNGLTSYVVPTDSGVCFVELEVNGALYQPGSIFGGDPGTLCTDDLDLATLVTVYDRFPAEMDRPAFSLGELPEQVDLGTAVFLTLPVACSEARRARPGELLRRLLGC